MIGQPVPSSIRSPAGSARQQLLYSRREFFSAAGVAPAVSRRVSKPVNVLFIVADDLNASLGCYGNPLVKIPNIDRLASRGVLFDRAYCQFPLCAPPRASFLSGRRPETTCVWTLHTPTRKYMQDVLMLPELFRKAGWFTAGIGKIYHNGPEHEDPRSWDLTRELPAGGKTAVAQALERYVMPKPRNHTMEWARLNTPDEAMPDGILARRAAGVIRKRVRMANPSFSGLGFICPTLLMRRPRNISICMTPRESPSRVCLEGTRSRCRRRLGMSAPTRSGRPRTRPGAT